MPKCNIPVFPLLLKKQMGMYQCEFLIEEVIRTQQAQLFPAKIFNNI